MNTLDDKFIKKVKYSLGIKSKYASFFEALKFLLFSISAGVIQIVSFTILYEALHIDYTVSYLISLALSVIWNFTFNRKFTFKSSSNIAMSMLLVILYYCAFTPFSTYFGDFIESKGVNGTLVTALMMLINFITEFFWQKYVVFRKNKKVVC